MTGWLHWQRLYSTHGRRRVSADRSRGCAPSNAESCGRKTVGSAGGRVTVCHCRQAYVSISVVPCPNWPPLLLSSARDGCVHHYYRRRRTAAAVALYAAACRTPRIPACHLSLQALAELMGLTNVHAWFVTLALLDVISQYRACCELIYRPASIACWIQVFNRTLLMPQL